MLLVMHVGICDLWKRAEEEKNGEQSYKARHSQICPLHILQPLIIVD